MKRYLSLAFLFLSLLLGQKVNATHIVGGEMFYDHIGGDTFKISLYTYIDCENGSELALALDTVAHMGIFSATTRALIDSFKVDTLRSVSIKDVNYNCLIPPTNICVKQYRYETTVVLEDIPGGYIIAYQRCCRNTTIINVRDQDDTGGTYWVKIPDRFGIGDNSSPRFNSLPPNFLCVNNGFSFQHNATDPDGDSLVYSLCIPYNGANPQAPYPTLPAAPPYRNITMNPGFGITNFMNAQPRLNINSRTGRLSCVPRRTGQFVVGICVKEYRNGILLSTVTRDFQFNVINCQFDVVTSFTLPEQQCDYEVDFKNESIGAIRYAWDFGDPTTDGDSSDKSSPSYTYPKPGWYDIELIGYSKECSDTFTQRIYVKPDTGAFAGPDVRSCNGESVKIGPEVRFPNSKYEWFPSTYLDNDTIQNPTANPPSDFAYVLKQTFDYCYGWDTLLVKVGPPEVDFDFLALEECNDLTYRFTQKGEGRTFKWDFGDGATSDGRLHYHTYTSEGKYLVKLVAFLNPLCSDSLEKEITVIEDTTDFAGYPRLLCDGDTIRIGRPAINKRAKYLWTPSKGLDDSTAAQPRVFVKQPTTYIVKRYTDYCEVFDTVFVDTDDPQPFFQLAYTAPCDGLNIKVYNRSTNVVDYLWDFGVSGSTSDTSTSSDSVKFVYPQNGVYDISLTGVSAKGCEETFMVPLNVFSDTGLFAGPDSNICRFQELEIGMDDSISFAKYRWSPRDSVSDYQIPNPTVKPSDTIVYVLEKIYPECTFFDSIAVGVHNPLANFGTDYDPHCDLFEITLKHKSKRVDRLFWDFGFDIVENNEDSVIFNFPGPGTYDISLYAMKEHCGDTITKTFKAYVDTGVTKIPDSVICLSDTIFLGALDTAKNARHLWTPADFLSSDTSANPQAWPTKTTVYRLQRIFPKCTYYGSVEVRVANPVASFDTIVRPDCYGFRAEFTNTSSEADKYRWVFNTDSTTSEEDAVILFPYGNRLGATLYAIDAHCVSEATVSRQLSPFEDFEVIRPNIFSPNGDSYNDCYKIEIPKLPPTCKNFEVIFFNRWGQEMFTIEQEGNTLCWDGTNTRNGVAVSPGVYFYIIRVLGREFTGTVQVVK